ncbi:MAG: hypothetical protein ACOC0J_00200, partial [Myxococcota bacterium]
KADGTPVTRPGGQVVDSDGYYLWVDLEPDPPYTTRSDERLFRWTFSFPVDRAYGLRSPEIEGAHRFRIVLPDGGQGLEVTTSDFDVLR